MTVEESSVLVPGPWTHRDVSANGVRLHVAEAGHGPLVLLLHGFPQFWWCWRHQLTGLAGAGYRAVAADLRGYGASDKPPRGYDVLTLADDVAGLVRALGERSAVLVGTDWGGLLAWVVATRHPAVIRRLVVVGMAHPLVLRRALLTDRAQRQGWRHLLRFQLPRLPERWLTSAGGANVARLLARWAGPGWPDPESAERYQAAMQIPGAAHSSLEYQRWAVRSLLRPDGLRVARLLQPGVTVPTLQLHGSADPAVPARVAAASSRFVHASYAWQELPGVGHFPAEEAPEAVTAAVARWIGDRDRDAAGRPRNSRRRDATGRPLPRGAAGLTPRPDDAAAPAPGAALAEAAELLAQGRPFAAHEVLEAVWKAAPAPERELWRGLAQLLVGLTHLQRGNAKGAAALLRRGAGRITAYAESPPYGLRLAELAAGSRRLADTVERDGTAGLDVTRVDLPLRPSPLGRH